MKILKKMNWQKKVITSIVLCLALSSILVLPNTTLAQSPPPRPTPGSPTKDVIPAGVSDNSDKDSGVINGDITGIVTDLSTGLPGAGLIVQINDISIKTDSAGSFSLTDIADGTYLVGLNLPAKFISAQPNQTVIITNRNKVNLTLGFYSVTPPIKTTSVPEELPQQLPATGGTMFWSYLRRGDVIGIMLVLAASMFHFSKISRTTNRNVIASVEL